MEQTVPTVSVIMTTYNRNEKYLRRSISSVLAQTFLDYEFFIIDDNGRDSSYSIDIPALVKSLHPAEEIKYIANENNMGAQKSRNLGLSLANGSYIAFLDDDDEWLPEKLERQVRLMEETTMPNIGLVYCWFNLFKFEATEKYEKHEIKPVVRADSFPRALLKKNFIGSTSFPLIKKSCFDAVGLFDENLRSSQDYDMWIRICEKYSIDYVPEILCNYYAHQEARITRNTRYKLDSELNLLEKHKQLIQQDAQALSLKYHKICKYYYALDDFSGFIKYLALSLMASPKSIKLHGHLFIMLATYPVKFLKGQLKKLLQLSLLNQIVTHLPN